MILERSVLVFMGYLPAIDQGSTVQGALEARVTGSHDFHFFA